MNDRMCQNFRDDREIIPLNTAQWLQAAGRRAFQTKLWYLSKNPFANEVYLEAIRDLKTALASYAGQQKKLIVVDLDDTMWGGVLGEVGWEGLRLGGHDYLGEAYQDFQRALKALKNRGFLLAIASKNEESIALEAIRRHPEMILKLEDFVGWRINWRDKAQNIADLVKELNLGINSVVFLDDSQHERQRVKSALPEVLVPDWPTDKTASAMTLLGLRCFDSPLISAEDLARTRMYQEENQRTRTKDQFTSMEDWLAALEIKVTLQTLNQVDLPRVVQLLNKTNQMNLSTRRLTEAEFSRWQASTQAQVWSVRVSDRYGDSGIVGVATVLPRGDGEKAACLLDFVLSCRVFGRKIEMVMLNTVMQWAAERQFTTVTATYLPTEKNGVCLEFLKKSGSQMSPDGTTFVWAAKDLPPLPQFITVVHA